MSSRAGDILSDFLEPLVKVDLPRIEDQSTEEVLAQLEEAEVAIRNDGHCDTVVGSLDVQALYPSLSQEESADLVEQFVKRSKVSVSGVDYREAQVYLSSTMTEKEIKDQGLQLLVPTRTKKFGPRPGNTTLELGTKVKDPGKVSGAKPKPSKWTCTDPDKLTAQDKRLILAKVIRMAVLTVFRHHAYQFNGVLYRQAGGGPIGLRLTSIIARIVMDAWASKFLVKLVEAGVSVHLLAKYVDDVNLVLAGLALGTRWVEDGLVHCSKLEEQDSLAGRSMEEVTMSCMLSAADSIIPWLKFTVDSPEKHASLTVPILDLQVWVRHPGQEEEGLGSDLLAWSFYEKPVSSDKLLRATSAYSWRNKLVTMAMELHRRLRNSTRQLTLRARAGIVEKFVDKLRRSGYGPGTVKGVLESGMSFYYRKLRIDLQGGPRLNDRPELSSEQVVLNKRQKLGATQSWFSRRRGGQQEALKKENNWRSSTPGVELQRPGTKVMKARKRTAPTPLVAQNLGP